MSAVATAAPRTASTAGSGAAGWLGRHNDVVLAVVIVAVISLMIFPVPPVALDILIALNIGVSVMLLMLSLYIPSALGLSTFPALLLFTTLFRLALNIASTKQILLHAHAGEIIETFGRLIVGGSVIVGLVVFLIIAIVQFIVIAKGSERVAEVGARFTLDAMPGKQMSIDADLRANQITADDAKRRRGLLEMESKLHGAMDGAMKFVKGDAIAGIIISAVNILAGIAIGVLVKEMDVGHAVNRYAILSIGDGMVSQIPSLLVSIAAGVLITRVSNENEEQTHLGGEISRQLVAHPMALLITGTVLAGFVVVPGFPKVVFSVLAVFVLGSGAYLMRERKRRSGYDATPMPGARRDGAVPVPSFVSRVEDSPVAVPLLVRLSSDVHGRVDPAALDAALTELRGRIRLRTGIPFPGAYFTFDPRLPAHSCTICVHELPAERIELPPGGTEPLHLAVLTAVERVLLRESGAFLGLQEVQIMLTAAQASIPDLVSEAQRALPLARIADAMRRLAEEHVSTRHLRQILEALIVYGPREKDPQALTELVRLGLGQFIVADRLADDGQLHVAILEHGSEDVLREAMQARSGPGPLNFEVERLQTLETSVTQALASAAGVPIVAIASSDVRRALRDLLIEQHPEIAVLSYQEVPAATKVKSIGQISLQPG
jgi:type III secretion protein V